MSVKNVCAVDGGFRYRLVRDVTAERHDRRRDWLRKRHGWLTVDQYYDLLNLHMIERAVLLGDSETVLL